MTRLEEKLYLKSVFNAIDEVYQLKNEQKFIDYEQRLRKSLNKLLIPDWYNPDYTSTNILRKSQSHGQVSRSKPIQNLNDSICLSSSNDTSSSSSSSHRYRSSSQAYSEKLSSFRRYSTISNSDQTTTTNVIINNRRISNSNGTPTTYAPGMQRVAQSSTWYKPKIFSHLQNGK